MTGAAGVFEVTTQLRGEAGDRQIEGAKVGMAHVIGLGSSCGIHILEKAALWASAPSDSSAQRAEELLALGEELGVLHRLAGDELRELGEQERPHREAQLAEHQLRGVEVVGELARRAARRAPPRPSRRRARVAALR